MIRFLFVLSACTLFCWAAETTAGEDDQRDSNIEQLKIHPDLEVQLFASEPMLLSPSAIDIDEKGRVWVCEVVNYRRRKGERPEGDRILILEDSNQDGRADKQTVFYQGPEVDSAHGVTVLGNEVIVAVGERVLVFRDENGDDKADGFEPMFTKIGGAQHDHGIHAVHFGPDGRLYFNFGNAGRQLCDKNGDLITDLAGNEVTGKRNPYQQGMVFRCELDGSQVDTLGWNFRNNWEVAVDSYGTIWQSDNDDDGNRGVRINYVMEYGNYGYRDEVSGGGWRDVRPGMHEDISQRHWHLNDPGVVPNLLQTGAGSPTGILVYEGDLLPKVFHQQIIHCDAGPNVTRAYPRKPDGAGYTAEILDILHGGSDRMVRPADVAVAPDGSLFVADWYDPGVGGHAMGDVARGRIYRLAPKEAAAYAVVPPDTSTIPGAIAALQSPCESTRYLGWTALESAGKPAQPALEQLFASPRPEHQARAIWLLARIHGQAIKSAASHANPDIRITALRAARQTWSNQPGTLHDLLDTLSRDTNAAVRREVALALRFDGSPSASAIWAQVAARHDGSDRWMLEALGIGADLHATARAQALTKVSLPSATAAHLAWRMRHSSASDELASRMLKPDSKAATMRSFHFHPDQAARQEALLRLFEEGSTEVALTSVSMLGREAITETPRYQERLETLLAPLRGKSEFVSLIDRMGLTGFESDLVDYIIANPNASDVATAARLSLRDSKLLTRGMASSPSNALRIGDALGKSGGRDAIRLLRDVLLMPENEEMRFAAASGLTWTQHGAEELFRASDKKGISPLLDKLAFRLATHPDKRVREKAAKQRSLPVALGTESFPPIQELLQMTGRVDAGKIAYTKATCINCHRVGEAGIDYGPNLSGIGNKLSKQAFYEAILYPDSGISHGYHGVTLKMKTGEVFLGFLTSETDEAVSLRLSSGTIQVFAKSKIQQRIAMTTSLMPSGLAALVGPQGLADLIAYLQSLK